MTLTSSPSHAERADNSGLLDWAGAARELATSERHVRLLWSERRISAVKIGRLVRFRPEDIARFIESNRHEAVR